MFSIDVDPGTVGCRVGQVAEVLFILQHAAVHFYNIFKQVYEIAEVQSVGINIDDNVVEHVAEHLIDLFDMRIGGASQFEPPENDIFGGITVILARINRELEKFGVKAALPVSARV